VGNGFRAKLLSLGFRPLEYMSNAHGVVDQDCVRQQTQATGPVHHLVVVSRAQHALISKEQPLRQVLPCFAAIQLRAHLLTDGRVVQVAKQVNGPHQLAQMQQRLGQAV